MQVDLGSASGFHIDPGRLTSIGGNADSIAAALEGPVTTGIPEGRTAGSGNDELALGAALTACTGTWEAHLRDTTSRVQAVGTLLTDTATKYRVMDGNAAVDLPTRRI